MSDHHAEIMRLAHADLLTREQRAALEAKVKELTDALAIRIRLNGELANDCAKMEAALAAALNANRR